MGEKLPKAPTIADIFHALPEEAKDEVAKMFFKWLAETASKVNSKSTLIAFGTLVQYHADDISLIIEHALKPEFRHLKKAILQILG